MGQTVCCTVGGAAALCAAAQASAGVLAGSLPVLCDMP